MHQLMLSYFTRPVVLLPQQDQFFRFKIGDTVQIDLSPRERKNLAFKYSLNKGMFYLSREKTNNPLFLFRKIGKFSRGN